MPVFTGVFAPIATPFRPDGAVDKRGLRENVARWMGTSLAGLVVLGSNGEAPQLDDDEADRVVDVARAGMPTGRPFIAGTGRALASIVPDECATLVVLVRESRLDEARQLQARLTPLAHSIGTAFGVAGLKAALDLCGYQGGAPRPLLVPAPDWVVDTPRSQLTSLGAGARSGSAPSRRH
jgi:dihydrodipicolinate synthase/N-acetylneuraminate lyase